MQQSVLCLPIKQERVLLGLKKVRFGEGKITGFGGKQEDEETPTQTVVREMREEAGLTIEERDLQHLGQLTFSFSAKPEWDMIVQVYRVDKWRGDPGESEEMKPQWFAFNEIPYSQMWADASHWLPLALQGTFPSLHFIYAADNETLASVQSLT
ncbi:MAG: 8-oxo-dGTP diphosphatase [Anaerolineae bacterium]|nr:8-oxo-dGTP diphosphatase [Anaerolineae bacterium]